MNIKATLAHDNRGRPASQVTLRTTSKGHDSVYQRQQMTTGAASERFARLMTKLTATKRNRQRECANLDDYKTRVEMIQYTVNKLSLVLKAD
eukprot:3715-Heterococcus_DN1.PRE.2